MENGEIKHFVEFQYKICYSKINLPDGFEPSEHYFNTKFVIAKWNGGYEAHFFKEFQYKICYSKIFIAPNKNISIIKFQYKICYSKIKELLCIPI